MARLVLVGLPGVGKTSVAQLLGVEWGCPSSLDTDDVLVSERWAVPRRCTCAARAKKHFAAAELTRFEALADDNGVVATGGGVVTTSAARELLQHTSRSGSTATTNSCERLGRR
jgi:shikimate kinase